MIQNAVINDVGLAQIRDALKQHHKMPIEHFSNEMLACWCLLAEHSFSAGNGCGFEIGALESRTGKPVTVNVSTAGYDIEEIEG